VLEEQNDNHQQEQPEPPTEQIEGPRIYSKFSPVIAGILGLVVGFFLFQICGAILQLAIFGLSMSKSDSNAMRLLQMGSQILFLLLPALMLAKYNYSNVSAVLRIHKPDLKLFFLFAAGMAVLIPWMSSFMLIQNYYFNTWANNIPLLKNLKHLLDFLNDAVEQSYGIFFHVKSFWDKLVIIAVVAVTPAICEEILFRGYIQKSFELRYNKFLGALITAVFFGLYHVNPYAFIPLTLLGLYFGYAVYMTDSIFVSMTLHFSNNFFSVILFFILGESQLQQNQMPALGELKSAYIALLFSSLLFVSVIIMIQRYYKNHIQQQS
jgi:membrane protease YdiL (CAAX protease family)